MHRHILDYGNVNRFTSYLMLSSNYISVNKPNTEKVDSLIFPNPTYMSRGEWITTQIGELLKI